MEEKHINRRKNFEESDWTKIKPNDEQEKIAIQEIPDITDRVITFNSDKIVKTKEDEYKDSVNDFKDGFSTTAQYLKFINAHLANKKDHLDKIFAAKERFSNDIASLNPLSVTKEQLDKKNYSNLKSDDIRIVIQHLEEEKNMLKEKIDHFTNNMSQAQVDLENKDKKIKEIESDIVLKLAKSSDESIVEKIDEPIETIQKELKSMMPNNESEKIFGAINSLVVLLNSKHQTTLKELNLVKNEFNKMKQEYKKVMNDLQKKKNEK